MDPKKRRKLQRKGWTVGSAQEFLGLSDQEMMIIDAKLALAQLVTKARKTRKLTQDELAKALGSSQSRIAKMEAGDPGVSVDLFFRALFTLGKTVKQVGTALGRIEGHKLAS